MNRTGKLILLTVAQKVLAVVLGVLLSGITIMTIMQAMKVPMRVVVSPSMAPAIKTGELLLLQETPFELIQKGDIISFIPDGTKTEVTHRVAAIDLIERKMTTKGDANDAQDLHKVTEEELIGVVRAHLPYLGYAAVIFTSWPGKITLIVLIIILMILYERVIYYKRRIVSKEIKKWWRISTQFIK